MDRYTKGFVLASLVYFFLPGQATESIRQSAMMHNVDEKKVLAELNEAAGLIQ